jgi:hypothetical protein
MEEVLETIVVEGQIMEVEELTMELEVTMEVVIMEEVAILEEVEVTMEEEVEIMKMKKFTIGVVADIIFILLVEGIT